MNAIIGAHAKNAPGPFYVVDGCCIACELPLLVAPELFAFDENNHCFVKRQPATKEELDRMLRVVWGGEVGCVRYCGKDPDVLRRFAEKGQPQYCDIAPAPGIRPVFRNHVSFQAADLVVKSLAAAQVAAVFQGYLQSGDGEWVKHRFTPTVETEKTAAFSYAWYEDNFHPVEFCAISSPFCDWLIRHSPVEKLGSQSVSFQVDDWLKQDTRFGNIRWYSKDEWNGSKRWQDTPW